VLKATVVSLNLDINWEQLSKKITANVVPQTQLIEIYATDSNPLTAKILADTIAQQLINLSPSGASQVNQDQLIFIQTQLIELQEKITSSKPELIILNDELDAANSARQIQDIQEQIDILDTKISNWQSTYAELLKTIEGGDVNALNIVEVASVPTTPFSPNTRMNVLLAAAIGCILAVGGIFIIEYFDDTVQAVIDTQSLVNLPTLAKIDRINGSKDNNKLIALENPLSPEVDSFRMLRMNLQSISNWQSLRTILLTSAEPSVGKSVTASNLAIVLAQYGNHVILVDADLRKPSLHKLFEINNDYGLIDLFIKSDLIVPDCLKKTKIENLLILTSGTEQISTVEALGSERMISVIKQLNSIADIVIIDCPPALLFSDAFLIGKLVNGVIVVSRVGRTRTEMLKQVVDDLRMAGINLLGVIIQQRKSSDKHGYRYYRYYSGSVKGQKKAIRSISVQKNVEGSVVKPKNK
jgi:capsular exopolysaccharide synthesis family protein